MRRSRNRNCYSSQDSKWLWCLFGSLHCACLLCWGWRACWIKSRSRWDNTITGKLQSCLNGCSVNLIVHGNNTWIRTTGWCSCSLFGEGNIFSIHHWEIVFFCYWESHSWIRIVVVTVEEYVYWTFCNGDLKDKFNQTI